MDRFFSVCLLLALLLMPARGAERCAQPVFFSMLFPQLVFEEWRIPARGEGVLL